MNTYKYSINGTKYEVAVNEMDINTASVTVNGEEYKVDIIHEVAQPKAKPAVKPAAAPAPKPAAAPAPAAAKPANADNAVKAPLPGTIIEIKVQVGDEVKAGEPVVVLEAMKMANNLEAERGGKVASICVQPGQAVMEGEVLVVFE